MSERGNIKREERMASILFVILGNKKHVRNYSERRSSERNIYFAEIHIYSMREKISQWHIHNMETQSKDKQ